VLFWDLSLDKVFIKTINEICIGHILINVDNIEQKCFHIYIVNSINMEVNPLGHLFTASFNLKCKKCKHELYHFAITDRCLVFSDIKFVQNRYPELFV